jgi:hypothetical protein
MFMKRVVLALAMAVVAGSSFAQTIFYGGDFDGRNSLASAYNGGFTHAQTFDDFTWNSSAPVDTVFAFFDSSVEAPNQALVEIRQGVSAGNAGTLIFGQVLPVTFQDLGLSPFSGSRRRLRVTADTPNINLTNGGTYHVMMALNLTGNTNAFAFVFTTSGANGIGSPLANGNSFFNSTQFGNNFSPASSVLGAGTWDFQYGLTAVVPEPATMAALGLGCVGLLRRRGRRA